MPEEKTPKDDVSAEVEVVVEETKADASVKGVTEKKPSKSSKKDEKEENLIPVKLLSKKPDDDGFYRVRDVSGGSEKIIYKVSADSYPYSYATQFVPLEKLERVL